MIKILVATATVGMLAAFSLAPQQAQAQDCSILTATAHGATQAMATRRAERRLRRYISRNLTGARVDYDDNSTECTGWGVEGFRATCESSAIVCR